MSSLVQATSNGVTVTSTTSTQEEVDRAAGVTAEEVKADEQTQAEPATAETTEEEKPKVKGGFQKRIDKLTKRNYELEAVIKAFEEKTAKPVEAQTADGKTIKLDDYPTVEEYVTALVKDMTQSELKSFLKQAEEQNQIETQQSQQRGFEEKYSEKLTAYKEAHPEVEEIEDLDIPIYGEVQQAILEADNGPEITYYLAAHPEEAKRLMELSRMRAVTEIGRISNRLEKPSSDQKPVSKVQPPIKPVTGAATKSTVSLEDLPPHEYIKRRNAELAAQRKR